MASRPLRIEVDRRTLIAALKKKEQKCQQEYKRSRSDAEYRKKVDELRKRRVAEWREESARLKECADKLAKVPLNKLVNFDRGGSRFGYFYLDEKHDHFLHIPRRERDDPAAMLDGYSNIIKMLEMSTKDSIALTEAQFAQYMDGCDVR